jgi:hypothetical protein
MTEPAGRLYFLDNLRALVVVLVVMSHTCVCYALGAPTWWYVVDVQARSLFLSILAALNDAQLMPIMFFVAGFFAWPSLQRKGAWRFAQDKVFRLGLPWVLGVVLLAPPTSFVARVTHQDPVGFIRFVTHDFWTLHFEQSVYWFLFLLLAFCVVLALAYQLMNPNWRVSPARTVKPTGWHFAALIGLLSGAFLVISLNMPAWFQVPLTGAMDRHVTRLFPFVVQPPRLPVYMGYFVLGVHAWRRNWFRPGGYSPRLGAWVAGYVLAMLVYLFFRQRLQAVPEAGLVRVLAFTSVSYNLFCFSALMAGLAVCQRYVNSGARFWRSLSADSFGIYFVHPLAVYPLALVLVGVPAPALFKSGIVFALALGWSWLFTAAVLRRAPLLRRMF